MKKKLNMFFSWTMLLLMFFNIAGNLFVFQLADYMNRCEMQSTIETGTDGQLVILKLPAPAHHKPLSFIRKDEHEILVNGKTYDVKKEVAENGFIYFYCINDTKEEQLNKMLADNVKSNSDAAPQKSHSSKAYSKNTLPDFIFTKDILCFDAPLVSLTFSFNIPFPAPPLGEIISPPPQA